MKTRAEASVRLEKLVRMAGVGESGALAREKPIQDPHMRGEKKNGKKQ